MGQKVISRFWWEVGLSSASKTHLTTFCKPSIHYANPPSTKIVFRDSSLYPKQLSLFCLLRSAQTLTALATLPISVA